jgi:hypothetical protein
MASNQSSNSARSVVGVGVSAVIGFLFASLVGIVYPAAKGNTLGIAAKHGSLSGSLMMILILSGPAGSGLVPSAGGGPSSSRGLDKEIGKSSGSTA